MESEDSASTGLIAVALAEVVFVVIALGDLLPTYRGLRMPILAPYAEKPPNISHNDAAGATLSYALTAVGREDITVVFLALPPLRVPDRTLWAVAILRAAVRRELSPNSETSRSRLRVHGCAGYNDR